MANLKGILTSGMRAGASLPTGIYTLKPEKKQRCWMSYCPAMRCAEGIYMKVILRVSSENRRGGHQPKSLRKGQWISRSVLVLGIEAEVFHAAALQNSERVKEEVVDDLFCGENFGVLFGEERAPPCV